MGTFTATLDVADFTGGGTAPALAYATIGRAQVDATTGEIVTTQPQSYRLTDTPVTVQLEQGTPYRVHLFGVAGVTDAFYVSATADATLATLYQSHQIDPSTLQPVTVVPSIASQIAGLQAQINAIPAAVTPVDNGDGTATLTSNAVTDNGDGTATIG